MLVAFDHGQALLAWGRGCAQGGTLPGQGASALAQNCVPWLWLKPETSGEVAVLCTETSIALGTACLLRFTWLHFVGDPTRAEITGFPTHATHPCIHSTNISERQAPCWVLEARR